MKIIFLAWERAQLVCKVLLILQFADVNSPTTTRLQSQSFKWGKIRILENESNARPTYPI